MNRGIFNHFTSAGKAAVEQFCKQINNSTSDIFILMARKSIVFIKALQQQNKLNFNFDEKLIIADTSFEFSSDYIYGRKITIIDDIMISGTAIGEMINKLLDIGVAPQQIDVIVLAVNQDYNQMEFKDIETGWVFFDKTNANIFSDSECINLSNCIAQMIAKLGEFYNADFPEYTKFELGYEEYRQLFNKIYWDIFEETNVFHHQGKNEVYTFIPKENTKIEIYRRMHFSAEQIVLFKLRLIAHKTENNSYICKFIPEIVVEDITFLQLQELWELLVYDKADTKKTLVNLNPKALFRLFHFFGAKIVADVFVDMNGLYDRTKLDNSFISVAVGHDCAIDVCKLADEIGGKSKADWIEIKKNISKLKSLSVTAKAEDLRQGAYDINNRLLEPFEKWYLKKEIKVRKNIINYINNNGTLNFRKDKSVLEKLDPFQRLKRGYTYTFLCDFIKDMKEYYRIDYVVSVFLDRAIDMGLIVPIYGIDEKRRMLCRVYRHGEDFPFGKMDKSRLLFFINEMNSRLNGEQLSRINFEKMMVLFMQLARKQSDQGIFNEFLGFDNHELLTVKYCIHGAVLVNVKQEIDVKKLHPYAENNNYCPWLKEVLEDDGIIEESNGLNGKRIIIYENELNKHIDKSALNGDVEKKIKNIAILLTEWYKAYAKVSDEKDSEEFVSINQLEKGEEKIKLGTKGFRRDITLLTSCDNYVSLAGSLLAELHYCLLDLEETVFCKLVKVKKSHDGFNYVLCEDCYNYFGYEITSAKEEKQYDTNAFFAMYNGISKAEGFLNGEKEKIIQRVRNIFDQLDSTGMMSNQWDLIWSESANNVVRNDSDVISYTINSMVYLYILYISYCELHNIIIHNDGKGHIINTQPFRDNFVKLVLPYTNLALAQDVRNLYQNPILMHQTISDQIIEIIRYLHKLQPSILQLCQNIEMYLAEKSDQYIQEYSYCTFLYCPKDMTNDLYSYLEKNCDINVQIFEWDEGLYSNIKTYALLFENNDVQDELQKHILLLRNGIFSNVHMLVIKNLPKEFRFRYNVYSSNRQGIVKFQKEVIDKLKIIYEPQKIELLDLHKIAHKTAKMYKEKYNLISEEEEIKLSMENSMHLIKFKEVECITIGIVTALEEETKAVRYVLDKCKKTKNTKYFEGQIQSKRENKVYKIILAQAPGYGNDLAAITANSLQNQYPEIKTILFVGIAGGIPDLKDINKDVHLGDVVLSEKVCQTDMIKGLKGGDKANDNLDRPSAEFITAFHTLEQELSDLKETEISPITKIINSAVRKQRRVKTQKDYFDRPEDETDKLEDADGNVIKRMINPRRIKSEPLIILGIIASANRLERNRENREKIKATYGANAIEMEGAGIADAAWYNGKQFFLIRGIVDYADGNKNDIWHNYGALVAAATMRLLIERL